MAIEFNCPHCAKLLRTSDERAHARALCPACNELITVPAPASSVAGGVPSAALAPTAAWSVSSPPAAAFVPPSASGASLVPTPLAPETSASPGGDAFSASPRSPMVCSSCRANVEAGSVYCSNCGSPLWEMPAFSYAPFWRRVAAVLIDGAIIALPVEMLAYVLPVPHWMVDDLGFAIWFFYFSVLESSSQQATFGKRIMGIMVCGTDGRRLSFLRAGIRTLAKMLSAMICGVGYIMPLLTLRRQALHDLLTDAIVVQK